MSIKYSFASGKVQEGVQAALPVPQEVDGRQWERRHGEDVPRSAEFHALLAQPGLRLEALLHGEEQRVDHVQPGRDPSQGPVRVPRQELHGRAAGQ